jgi:uncharacterized membrane protein YeaQ/YmgE (transglycosylase-associated protein family)
MTRGKSTALSRKSQNCPLKIFLSTVLIESRRTPFACFPRLSRAGLVAREPHHHKLWCHSGIARRIIPHRIKQLASTRLPPHQPKGAFRMVRILGALFSGFLIGLLARWFYPGSVHLGVVATILLGVGGSLLAELVARKQGSSQQVGCLASVLGAMALILIGRLLG